MTINRTTAIAVLASLCLLTSHSAMAQTDPAPQPDPSTQPAKTKLTTLEKATAAVALFGAAMATYKTMKAAKKANAQNGSAPDAPKPDGAQPVAQPASN